MTARVIHSPVSPGPRSPRAKSFAQHLLEIEQEAARAASRCRSSHTRASLAFGDAPPSPSALPPPGAAGGAAFSSPSRTPTARAMDAVTPAAASAAAAELARRRAEVEVHVLRRALPELEEALDAQSGLLQASLAQQQTLARVRIQQDAALREAKATNQHLTAEVAGLRAQNDALERQAHAQAAELARLRERLGSAGGASGADYTSPDVGGGRPLREQPLADVRLAQGGARRGDGERDRAVGPGVRPSGTVGCVLGAGGGGRGRGGAGPARAVAGHDADGGPATVAGPAVR